MYSRASRERDRQTAYRGVYLQVKRLRCALNSKTIHRILGCILLLPLLAWVFTGIVFLTKPGYSGAYQQLAPRLYPIEIPYTISPEESWVEARLLKTILGYHLLVNTGDKWMHLDPLSLKLKGKPEEQELIEFLEDAIHFNRQRYGVIEKTDNDIFITSTGVELTLDWDTLYVAQQGRDTKIIGLLYKIHYLQWLGQKQANIIFGIFGLSSLFVLAYCGAVLLMRGRKTRS